VNCRDLMRELPVLGAFVRLVESEVLVLKMIPAICLKRSIEGNVVTSAEMGQHPIGLIYRPMRIGRVQTAQMPARPTRDC